MHLTRYDRGANLSPPSLAVVIARLCLRRSVLMHVSGVLFSCAVGTAKLERPSPFGAHQHATPEAYLRALRERVAVSLALTGVLLDELIGQLEAGRIEIVIATLRGLRLAMPQVRSMAAERSKAWRLAKRTNVRTNEHSQGVQTNVRANTETGSEPPPSQTLPLPSECVSSSDLLDKKGENTNTQKGEGSVRGETERHTRTHTRPAFANSSADGEMSRDALMVGKAYKERWEQVTGTEWNSFNRNHDALKDIAAWVRAQAARDNTTVEETLSRLLDAFFADDWATKNKYPLASLSKNPGRYYEGSTPETELERVSGQVLEMKEVLRGYRKEGRTADADELERVEYRPLIQRFHDLSGERHTGSKIVGPFAGAGKIFDRAKGSGKSG